MELENQLKALRPISPSSKLRQKCFAVIDSQKQRHFIRTYKIWGIAAAIMIFLSIWSYRESIKIQRIIISMENSPSNFQKKVKKFLHVGIENQKTLYIAHYQEKSYGNHMKTRAFLLSKSQ